MSPFRIPNDAEIPADMVLLTSSEESGTAYIETANIDGEANLKVKNSAKTGLLGKGPKWKDPAELKSIELSIHCELPNSAIHQFNGCMIMGGTDNNNNNNNNNSSSSSSSNQDHRDDKTEVPLDISSFLLRGSTLRNTRWIVGVVVYSGNHTKLVMNSRAAPFKISSIERTMNNILLVVLAALIFISTVCTFVILLTPVCYIYPVLDTSRQNQPLSTP